MRVCQVLLGGIPEWCVAASAFEDVWHAFSGTLRYQRMASLFVFARGLRGLGGVTWLRSVALDFFPAPLAGPSGGSAKALFRDWAKKVTKAFWAECRRRGDRLWASHREGRHAGVSGWHFVAALRHDAAMNSACGAVERAVKVFEAIDQVNKGVLSDTIFKDMLRLWEGVTIAVRARDDARCPSHITASKYSAMDVARFLYVWACHTGLRLVGLPFFQSLAQRSFHRSPNVSAVCEHMQPQRLHSGCMCACTDCSAGQAVSLVETLLLGFRIGRLTKRKRRQSC